MPGGVKQVESHTVTSSMAGALESADEKTVEQTAHAQPRAGCSIGSGGGSGKSWVSRWYNANAWPTTWSML
ncbi:hypothetical protein ALQ93_102782 [Pseudomonas syringae pv. pisi]|uniref:Uncharacterized protein n=1 Tax=Pseudomonas syringae pv. pisi TaxID=59510 RepID=A0A3M3UA69_PSESJ|nr:hypothetical protein ALQ93_102782 [Pseudomonas syringae pv. pisi]RML66160.1 hypothetical protein ALQ92_102354 [Pseudomonas syringae pv. pisi]RMM23225.1 hypothetical protein ALQ82_102345 [Pseudomonas syringae pv. pisi]RMO29990.1 hypothetical protein ALQ44_102664 [Pseudomonas syringae pv. pisi]